MTVLKPISLESHVVHQSAPPEKQSSNSTRMRGRSGKRSGGPDRNHHLSRERSNSNPYQRPSSSRPSTSRQNDRGSSRPPARQHQQAPPPPPKQQPKSKPAPKQPAKKFSGKQSLNTRVLLRLYGWPFLVGFWSNLLDIARDPTNPTDPTVGFSCFSRKTTFQHIGGLCV